MKRRTPKRRVTSNREMRALMERTIVGLQTLSKAVSVDFEQAGQHMNATREFMTGLAERLDALEMRIAEISSKNGVGPSASIDGIPV